GIWGERIVPVGVRSAADVAAIQASVPFVVVPSVWDTFNYTLPEAMSLGCVTLGSTGAGSSYLIQHQRNGFTFLPDDPALLGSCLLEAHRLTADDRRRIGTAARETIAIELDPAECARASLAALSSLTVAPRPAPLGPWIREFFEVNADRPAGAGHL